MHEAPAVRTGHGLTMAIQRVLATAVCALVLVPGAAGAHQAASPLAGVPQQGLWLGRPHAGLTLVEYVDVQCPFCGRFAREVFPQVVRRYVRTGRVRILFRGLAFVGPDSLTGLRWVVAAGRQNRLWNMLEGLYAHQGAENSGWITTSRLAAVARRVPGLHAVRLRRDSMSAGVTAQIRAAAAAAHAAGVPGTPYFEAGRSLSSLAPLKLTSFDPRDFTPQLDALLKQ